MTIEEEPLLNHSEFIVLGLLSEENSHAYQLNEKIEERGMREWTSIGKSSIYRVIKDLEEKDFAERWIEEVDNRVVKKYQITPKGQKTLKKHVYEVLEKYYGRNDEDFYVAFSMLPILDKQMQIKALSKSIGKMKKHIKELEEMLKGNSHLTLNVKGLFIQPIEVLKTDIKFLEWVIEEIEKDNGRSIPNEYMQ
jgi:DNA-binding PadR family transcriptional regulator